jgi:hypothetical protein
MQHDDSLFLIVLYVYDLLMIGNLTSAIDSAKSTLDDRFSMTDLGLLHYFIGLEVSHSNSRIDMEQYKYSLYLLVHFQMIECKPATSPFLSGVRFEDVGTTPLVDITLYRQLVGSLLYLTHT